MAVRLVSRSQILNNNSMKYTLRCCNPLCHETATWVANDGQHIWCGDHIQDHGKESWDWE